MVYYLPQFLKVKSSQLKIHKEKLEFENTQAPIDVKFFELFFETEVINHLCEQSKIYTNNNGYFTFNVTSDEFSVFLAILLISEYMLLPHRRMYWEQAPNVFICAVPDLLSRNRFEEMLRYLHLADNAKLIQGGKLVKIRPFYNIVNQRFLKAF